MRSGPWDPTRLSALAANLAREPKPRLFWLGPHQNLRKGLSRRGPQSLSVLHKGDAWVGAVTPTQSQHVVKAYNHTDFFVRAALTAPLSPHILAAVHSAAPNPYRIVCRVDRETYGVVHQSWEDQ